MTGSLAEDFYATGIARKRACWWGVLPEQHEQTHLLCLGHEPLAGYITSHNWVFQVSDGCPTPIHSTRHGIGLYVQNLRYGVIPVLWWTLQGLLRFLLAATAHHMHPWVALLAASAVLLLRVLFARPHPVWRTLNPNFSPPIARFLSPDKVYADRVGLNICLPQSDLPERSRSVIQIRSKVTFSLSWF